jgi:GTP cyclohydrolase I
MPIVVPRAVLSIEEATYNILRLVGEDPEREGLKGTPARVAAFWVEALQGYHQDPQAVLNSFADGAEGYDEMVVLKDIPFASFCEHHMLPFSGVAHVGYVPNPDNKRIVGISKLARLVDVFAKRLQVQERLTYQVTDALMQSHLDPAGAACVVEAGHTCLACRGVKKPGAVMVTSSLCGVFLSRGEARAEFLALVRG